MTVSTLDAFRLELGDRDSDRPLFNDNEAQYFIDQRPGNILLAVADACDSLARRFSREHDFEWTGGQNAGSKFSRSQMAKAYTDQAKALRNRAGGGVTAIQTTRVDGYSDDLDSREGAGESSSTGRVRAGYTDPDLPV